MKINDTRKVAYDTFGAIATGTAFQLHNHPDDSYYLKLAYTMQYLGCLRNAVDISTGTAMFISDDAYVCVLNAELTIK